MKIALANAQELSGVSLGYIWATSLPQAETQVSINWDIPAWVRLRKLEIGFEM
jgi:hypothetical protein